MKLEDQVHISREENRAQKSQQQPPQIPLLCEVTNMPHATGGLSPTMTTIAVTSSACRHFSGALEGSLLAFRVLAVNLQCSRLLCVLGSSRHVVMAAITLRNMTNAKKWNLWSLWKASKNVSTHCLPTLCWMPTLAGCLVLNVPDRPSYKERKCFGSLKGGGAAFLMWMARLKEIVAGWGGAFRKGTNKRTKEKETASTYVWWILCSSRRPMWRCRQTTVTLCSMLDDHGKMLAWRFSRIQRPWDPLRMRICKPAKAWISVLLFPF